MAAVDQPLHQRDDILEVRADARLDVRVEVAEPVHVLRVGIRKTRREIGRLGARLRGALEDLVVDVRDVSDVGDLHSIGTQVSNQDVVDDVAAGVTQMRVVVDRGAADVDAGVIGFGRLERLLLARQGVVQAYVHGRRSLSTFRPGGQGCVVDPIVRPARTSKCSRSTNEVSVATKTR